MIRELNDLLTLLATLKQYTVEGQNRDGMVWVELHKWAVYSQGQLQYHVSQNGMIDKWPWKHVWKIKTTPKVTCLTWFALNEASLTQDNLNIGKTALVNKCYMCL